LHENHLAFGLGISQFAHRPVPLLTAAVEVRYPRLHTINGQVGVLERIAVIAIGRVEGDQGDRAVVHAIVAFLVALIGAVVARQLPVAVPFVVGAHYRWWRVGAAFGMPV